jgi:hypothetical protein
VIHAKIAGIQIQVARAVRIEISPERSLLLPFDEFLSAELVVIGKEQQLKLIFAAHEVLIRGHSLRRIETAMQRMDLSLLTKVMDDYRPLIAQGQPVILEIIVSEIKPPAVQPNVTADSQA